MDRPTQDAIRTMDVREILDLSPEVRRYLLRVIPDIWCRGGQTLETVASAKKMALEEIERGIYRELHKSAAEELGLGTTP